MALLLIFLGDVVFVSASTTSSNNNQATMNKIQCKPVPLVKGAYHLVIKDHKFIPKKLVVLAGKPFQLVVKNNNSTPSEFESTSLHQEKIVFNGSSSTVYIGALTSGAYEFFDDFHHASTGKLMACNP